MNTDSCGRDEVCQGHETMSVGNTVNKVEHAVLAPTDDEKISKEVSIPIEITV